MEPLGVNCLDFHLREAYLQRLGGNHDPLGIRDVDTADPKPMKERYFEFLQG